jgi:Type I restriction modification DNA specificity domain
MVTTKQMEKETLPTGWEMMLIEQLAPKAALGKPKKLTDLIKQEGTIPLILSGDLENDTKEIEIGNYTTLEALQERKLKPRPIIPGTVLLVAARKKGGNVGILNVEQAIFNNAIYAIPPNPGLFYPDWLFYYFKNPRIKRIIQKDFMIDNATFANVKLIQKLEVPIPPLPQQEQLLIRIQALLPNVEKAQALLKQNQTAIDLLLNSALQEIFTPARRRTWNHQSLKELITIDDTFPLPIQPSDNLYYHPLTANDIHPVLARATIDLTRSENTLFDTSFSLPTNNQNVIICAKNYDKDTLHLRTAMPYKDSRPDQQISIDGFKCSSDLYQLTVFDNRILPRFLFWSLLYPQLMKAIKGDTLSKKKFTILPDKIYSSELFFPKPDEQEHISTYLDSVQEKVSRMYANQIASMQAIEKMEESILNQAFAGKL